MNKYKYGFEETICGIFLIVVFVSVMIQVINRFLIGISIPWTEELARYSFIWLSFLGISIGVKRNKHMFVDFLKVKFSLTIQRKIEFIVDALLIIIFIMSSIYGFSLFNKTMVLGQLSPALEIKMAYIFLASPVGFALATFRIIQNNIVKIRKGVDNCGSGNII